MGARRRTRRNFFQVVLTPSSPSSWCTTILFNRHFFFSKILSSGRKHAVALYELCPCEQCRKNTPPLRQQRRTINRHLERQRNDLRIQALLAEASRRIPVKRRREDTVDPGKEDAVEGHSQNSPRRVQRSSSLCESFFSRKICPSGRYNFILTYK